MVRIWIPMPGYVFEKGKYVEAKIYIDQAMQNDGSKSSVVVEHCGDIYYMNGDREKALEYWQQAGKIIQGASSRR